MGLLKERTICCENCDNMCPRQFCDLQLGEGAELYFPEGFHTAAIWPHGLHFDITSIVLYNYTSFALSTGHFFLEKKDVQ
jgi:hypothetical protein